MANPGYGVLDETDIQADVSIRQSDVPSGDSSDSVPPSIPDGPVVSINSSNSVDGTQQVSAANGSIFTRRRKPDKTPLLRSDLMNSVNGPGTGQTMDRPNGLSTFAGVFCPVALSMFSVLLFLRSGYVVGQAGILLTLGQLTLAYMICTMTVLSLSAVSTNGAIEGGGVYYMISRALGPEFGGSIGTLFFFANVFSCALYTSGFTEALVNNFGDGGYLLPEGSSGLPDSDGMKFVYGFVISLLMLVICLVGASVFAKMSVVLLAVIMLAYTTFLLSAFITGAHQVPLPRINDLIYTNTTVDDNGTHVNVINETQYAQYTGISFVTFRENLMPEFVKDYTTGTSTTFAIVFAVVFSGVTGIMAGANMSGELKRPNAVLFTYVTYVLTALMLGLTCSRHLLLNNYVVMQSINLLPQGIVVAVFGATIFAGMSNMIGASRILNRLAEDRIFGSMLHPVSLTFGASKNPIPAVAVSWMLSVCVLLVGALNRIATITSIFFLLSYMGVNLATLALDLTSAPNFRPQFRFFNWLTALVGAVFSVVMCFVVDASMSGVAIILLLLLLMALHYKVLYFGWQAPVQSWGSISQALIFHQVRKYLLLLDPRKEHVKYWRPQMLLLVKSPSTCAPLIDFMNDMKKSGLYVIGHIRQGQLDSHAVDPLHEDYPFWWSLVDYLKVKAFIELTLSRSTRDGVHQLTRLSGVGAMKPNTVILGFCDDARPENNLVTRAMKAQRHHGKLDRAEVVEYFTARDFPPMPPSGQSSSAQTGERLSAKEYVNILTDVLKLNKNLCLARHFHLLNKDDIIRHSSRQRRFVDVWPVDICRPQETGWGWDNSCLFVLQLACIVSMTHTWKHNTTLRVFLCVTSLQDMHRRERQLKEMLGNLRISARSLVVPWDHVIVHLTPIGQPPAAMVPPAPGAETGRDPNDVEYEASALPAAYIKSLNEMIVKHSQQTAVVFMNMPGPPQEERNFEAYLDTLRRLTDGLPPTMLVHGLSSVISTAL